MLVNKRRNSDTTAGDKADLDITAPRQTEKTATELFSFVIIWWSFLGLVRFFKGRWDMGTWRRRFEENGLKNRALTIWYDHKLNFFSRLILWATGCNTSFLLFYLGLDMWIFSVGDSGGKITKHHKKGDAPLPTVTQIRFGNPPPLLDLINRHS